MPHPTASDDAAGQLQQIFDNLKLSAISGQLSGLCPELIAET